MTYAQAVAHLYALAPELAGGKDPRRFDLAHMRRLCLALGDPQREVPAVLIAGTNGKGSTAATLAAIATAAGYRTGLYTSPHLIRVNERIQLAHPVMPSEYGSAGAHGTEGALALSPIADSTFAELYTRVDTAGTALVHSGELPLEPSFFERLTAVAFLFFAEQRAELSILEVGLGGRLDATNVVEPLLAVLTDVALDHQQYLGDTIALITAEKCGILRPGGTLVTLPQHPEANQAIGEAAMRLGVHGINAADYLPGRELQRADPARAAAAEHADPARAAAGDQPHYHPRQGVPSPTGYEPGAHAQPPQLPRNRYTLALPEGGTLAVDSPLPGTHQQRNIALAIAAAVALRHSKRHIPDTDRTIVGYEIADASIEAGIRATAWPGRLEFLPPNLLLDVAHNPAGAWTLRSALATLPEQQPRTLIFSCLRDKDLTEMARILFPLFDASSGDPMRRGDHIILAPIASPRAAAVAELLEVAHALAVPAHAAPHLAGALAQARQITPADGLIVATGSVYLVGEVRELALAEAG